MKELIRTIDKVFFDYIRRHKEVTKLVPLYLLSKLSSFRKLFLLQLFFLATTNSLYSQLDSITHLKLKIKGLQHRPEFNPNDIGYIDLLNKLGWQIRYYNKDSLLLLSQEAHQLSQELAYEKGVLESTFNLAQYYLFNGDPERTVVECSTLMASIPNNKFARLKHKVLNQMGQANFILGNYPEAYSSFLKSLEIAEKYNYKLEAAEMNMNLGTLFSLLEDYEEAINYYDNTLKELSLLKNKITNGRVFSNLGFLYMKKKDMKKSLEFLDKSIDIFVKHEVPEWLAFAFITKGELYLGNKEYEKSLEFYKKAQKIHDSLEDVKGRADVNHGIGAAYLGLGNIDSAELHVQKSLELFKSFQLKTGLEKCYRALYEINKKKGLTDIALSYLELEGVYADSISKNAKQRDIAMLNSKMEFEQAKLAIDQENQDKINTQKKYVQWATLGLIFLLIVVGLMIKFNRKEKQLNKALAEKTIILSENQKRMKQINSNQDKLFSIVGHDLRGPIVSLKELMDLALESPNGAAYFKKFGPKLKNDIEHIHFTLDNLLYWGTSQMKGSKLNPEAIMVKSEIASMKNLFRKRLSKKSISLENYLTEDMTVFMDPNHFNVVFRNLISNAIKFTPENGKISISAKENLNNLIISVKDSGIGMSEEILHKIFNTSEHYSSYGTNGEKGTGLGLGLCKEMIAKNNGSIEVKSIPNKGSEFLVLLPKSKPKA